jgi:transcription-repair coupling factor (superfamily II helicase)
VEKSTPKLLIVALTPLILEKGLVWFQENEKYIQKSLAAPLDSPSAPLFWRKNAFMIEEGQQVILSEVLRKLVDFGYEKYQRVELPGEFAQAGGTITIFPINSPCAYRIEFNGNTVESINTLRSIENNSPETPLGKIIFPKGARRREIPADLLNLTKGDYVVHIDHGIGKFCEKKHIQTLNDRREYVYVVEYAAGDMLTVPEAVSHKLSPYIGFATPEVHRLGGNLWHATKRKIKEDIIQTAKELLAIYARREIAQRPPYVTSDAMLTQIDEGFEFEETSDQKRAIEEILSDMEKHIPMDRLICGDVGFGKTEIAIRAAARAAISGRQTILITPTTILAWQHFQTFMKRFSQFPIRIACLSRIQTRLEQKSILEDLKSGTIDILIATHRALQNDVTCKNMGLLIIDEEQRFGVRQKEKLKGLRSNVDVLSLSATPIPRTLSLALSGLKNISSIQTPPPNRHPIQTFVFPRSKKIIQNAMQEELARGGQVYYLHNRIATIGTALQKIRELTGAHTRIALAHAKLPDAQLIEIIDDFRNHKSDILVATTIIENGLDLSNVNTLIVEDASRLGLAQAHQLRGRIGRGDRQAYAYFLYSPKKLTEIGKKRLEILEQHQNLGAGFEIAMKDLEIRGAGNILGREQHGSINKIGLNLYCQMLNEAVEELKNASSR